MSDTSVNCVKGQPLISSTSHTTTEPGGFYEFEQYKVFNTEKGQ